jgi:hypothetical protein
MPEGRLSPAELIAAHERKLADQQAIPDEMTMLELAEAVVRGKIALSPQQQRMLIELLPFHAPKQSTTATINLDQSALDRCIERSITGKPLKVIEGGREPAQVGRSASDTSGKR